MKYLKIKSIFISELELFRNDNKKSDNFIQHVKYLNSIHQEKDKLNG